MSYIIIKYVKMNEGRVPVILLDELGEVLTFETEAEATTYRDLFQKNSDSGHLYRIKHIAEKV